MSNEKQAGHTPCRQPGEKFVKDDPVKDYWMGQKECTILYEDLTIGELSDGLRRRYPYGHPGFVPMTLDEIDLHSRKNHDYAHGGKPTGNFDRVGALVAMYPGIDWSKPHNVATMYALKQLDAVLWLESQGIDGAVEGKDARWGDISVYSKLIRLILKDNAKDQIDPEDKL